MQLVKLLLISMTFFIIITETTKGHPNQQLPFILTQQFYKHKFVIDSGLLFLEKDYDEERYIEN